MWVGGSPVCCKEQEWERGMEIFEVYREKHVLTPSPFLIQSCDNILSLQKHSQMVRTSKVISLVIYLQLDKVMM
jgi:hypothetical protein